MEVTAVAVGHIHIGSGTEALAGLPGPEEIERRVRAVGLDRAAQEFSARILTGYAGFASAGDRLCIPGSSVKGNVRSRIELSLVSRRGQSRSCFIRASPPRLAQSPRAWRHRRIWGNVLSEDRGFPCDLTKGNAVCLVCDLFGTAGLKGLIEFSDLTGEGVVPERIDVLPGLRLMAAPPGSKFRGLVGFRNLRLHELGLLLHGMGLVEGSTGREVMLGRLKYVGQVGGRPFGRVRYRIDAFRLSKLSEQVMGWIPGTKIEGTELEKLAKAALNAARSELGDELRTVDEVVRG